MIVSSRRFQFVNGSRALGSFQRVLFMLVIGMAADLSVQSVFSA